MACFIVPAAEAVVVTAAYLAAKKKEQKIQAPKIANGAEFAENDVKITWSRRLGWLMGLLWGGVLLLAFEHFWHGEIVPFPPFLSTVSSPEDRAVMLSELSTVGVSMALAVTAVWGAMCAVAQAKISKLKKSLKEEPCTEC